MLSWSIPERYNLLTAVSKRSGLYDCMDQSQHGKKARSIGSHNQGEEGIYMLQQMLGGTSANRASSTPTVETFNTAIQHASNPDGEAPSENLIQEIFKQLAHAL